MAHKKIQVVSGCVHYGKEVYTPDSKPFLCEVKEAQRLIDLGVAIDPNAAPVMTAAEKKKLLKAVASAKTVDDLKALMPDDEPEEDVKDAFEVRMAELEK